MEKNIKGSDGLIQKKLMVIKVENDLIIPDFERLTTIMSERISVQYIKVAYLSSFPKYQKYFLTVHFIKMEELPKRYVGETIN